MNDSPRYRSPRFCPGCLRMRWPGDCAHGLIVDPGTMPSRVSLVPAGQPALVPAGPPAAPAKSNVWDPFWNKLQAAKVHREKDGHASPWGTTSDEKWLVMGTLAAKVPEGYIKNLGIPCRKLDPNLIPDPIWSGSHKKTPCRRAAIFTDGTFTVMKLVGEDGREKYVQTVYAEVFDGTVFHFLPDSVASASILAMHEGKLIGVVMPVNVDVTNLKEVEVANVKEPPPCPCAHCSKVKS
jgi:hypothetical protein